MIFHHHIVCLIICIHVKRIYYNRTAEEEEGIRASEAIDRILSRLSKSDVVVKGKPIR